MVEFDPEQFEDKYANYFPQLQRAYKNAFNRMNDTYDSTLIHAIDQQVLNESEPFYNANREGFDIELPDEPYSRLEGVVVDEPHFESVLNEYVEQIDFELQQTFRLTE